MIPTQLFGRTGHQSSRIIFGGYALSDATQAQADEVLELLLEYGVNHIDTAPMYGKSEERIGPWMEKHRDQFFIATKTRSRGYQRAMDNLHRSLEHLRVDYIDLWQMHSLTNPQGWEKAMGTEGTIKAFLEARDKGLVRYLGVTGHSNKCPQMHLQSLERFDFDSVMLQYNYPMMQIRRYTENFNQLLALCRKRNVALQTIKSIARRSWGDHDKTHNTYFYEPLQDQDAIDKAVHWAMGLSDSFVVTAGDLDLLPKVLSAAARFETRPSDEEMEDLVGVMGIETIFP